MKARSLLALVVVGSVLVSGPAAVAAQQQPSIRGSPDLDLHVPNPTVNPGETNQVTVQVSNNGDMDTGPADARQVVTTARNVRVEAEAGGTPLTVETGEMAIGSVSENRPGNATIAVSVPDDVDPGTYSIDVDVSYSHTYHQSSTGVTQDRSRTKSIDVEVEVSEDARFEIVNVTTDAQVGDSGTLEAEIENIGADTARDINVVLESSSAGFGFGENARDSARIDELEPGERTTVTYDVAIAPDAPVRQYALDGTVQFRTPEGLQRVDESPTAGVTPQAEQRFSLNDVESTLYVGEEGVLRGTVTNEGSSVAQNVVVQYADKTPNLVPIESGVAVGNLDAGESASFRIPIEVSDEAEAIPRTVDMAVQYRNQEFEQRAYQDLEVTAEVAPQRDQFVLDVQNREIEAGETIEVDVEVTNNMDQTVSNVEARMFADSPLDSTDDEAFTETLEPGDSTTMTFELEADASASAKTYPVSFDFRYDDERGNSQLSDTTRVAIGVVESEGGFPWLTIVVGVLALGIAGAVYSQRR